MASPSFLAALRRAADGRVIASIEPREVPNRSTDDEDLGVRVWFEAEEGKPDWVEIHAQSCMCPDSVLRPVLTLTWPAVEAKSMKENDGPHGR